MRWSNLDISEDQRARLPGYRDEALVRHFDAPEAVRTRFYEVRARSILNRVPEASQVPFRWTINPYRGCTHACVYCLHADTPILRADGTHAPIADLEVGDAICGTVVTGGERRYTPTTVLDKWVSVKPAFRVRLEDGTELIASGDHRFLTETGFKHVTDAHDGPPRPHLTLDNRMLGTGAFAAPPQKNRDYRHGYLCAIVPGAWHVGLDSCGWGRRSSSLAGRGALAVADLEALRRVRGYIEEEEVAVCNAVPSWAVGSYRDTHWIDTSSGGLVERVRGLIEWPVLPSLDWCRGFLAGSFDANGSLTPSVLRISTVDRQMLAWIDACARRLGFECVAAPTEPAPSVLIRGGLSEQLRFLHATDPAISRKRSIEGRAVETRSHLRVAQIESLGCRLALYDITTGTGDFIANGVISHNCFARPTHDYLGFNPGRDFEREIVVKVNAPELLGAELARPSWQGEHIALGTNTDPYQWVEGRYKLMRGIWAALRDAANPCSVLTKSPLLLRDLDLMRELDDRTDFSAALSVPTLDERAWRATEPRTPHPRARLEALGELTRAGIRTGILVAPLMPGINDAPEQVEPILEAAADAGAAYVSGIGLHLRRGVREVFMEWLEEQRPDLVARYGELYRRGAYLPMAERKRLSGLLYGPDVPTRMRMRGGLEVAPPTPAPPPQAAQESLF